ncbi:alpha-1B-glycoprotein-like [Chelonoidis abingdonii]|uniref:alpha-1B-glycoprotein-like n=1 Tax=Chelonoidis abingdonii TaxID=106734 RepID=UPI003F497F5A
MACLLLAAETYYPKPSISLRPSMGVALGGAVTIQCWGRHQNMRFLLYKDGNPNALQDVKPARDMTQFPIHNVSRKDAGSYSCYYRSKSDPPVWSYPSDPVELVVAELRYPKPSISLHPSAGVALGGAVTVQCRGWRQNMRFLLHKFGNPNVLQDVVLAGNVAEFPIHNREPTQMGSRSRIHPRRSRREKGAVILEPPNVPSWWVQATKDPGMELVLHKAGHLNLQVRSVVPKGKVAEFPITSVSQEDGGSYTCNYRSITEYSSDPVEIIVGEPSYPKPNISLSPSGGVSLGGAVAIWCRRQSQGVRFVLNKEGRHFPPVDSDGFGAVFPISNVSREDGGSYSCSYHRRSEPFTVSYPSDPVELVVRDPSLTRPNISLSLTGVMAPGADVIIWCQGQRRDVRFFLHKAGDLNLQQQMDPTGAGAVFRIPSVGRQHGGSYSCSYRPQSEPFVSSQPSDTVQLVVAEPSYPKPNISGIPSRVVSLGAAVTIRCEGQHQGMRFLLNKEGRHFPPVDSGGFVAEFLIRNVSREDGGSYNCSYHSRSEPFNVSYPSDPMELVVRDPSLPRPNISLSLTGVTTSGADVTIWCQGQRRDVRFFLHKAGDLNLQQHMDPAGDVAEFRIPTVGRQHGGSYSCSYRPPSEPFISSLPSDPVELVVAGGSELKLSIPIIAGVSASAVGLLLLLAFLCYRQTRGAPWCQLSCMCPQGERVWAYAGGRLRPGYPRLIGEEFKGVPGDLDSAVECHPEDCTAESLLFFKDL